MKNLIFIKDETKNKFIGVKVYGNIIENKGAEVLEALMTGKTLFINNIQYDIDKSILTNNNYPIYLLTDNNSKVCALFFKDKNGNYVTDLKSSIDTSEEIEKFIEKYINGWKYTTLANEQTKWDIKKIKSILDKHEDLTIENIRGSFYKITNVKNNKYFEIIFYKYLATIYNNKNTYKYINSYKKIENYINQLLF